MKKQHEGKSHPQPNQRIPAGNFNHEGVSQGKKDGAVRPTPDAYQGERPKGEQSK